MSIPPNSPLQSIIVSILAMHPIYGERRTSGEIIDSINQQRGYGDRVLDLHLSWDRAWAVGATLRVVIEREKGNKAGYGGSVPCVRFRTGCDIGWSGSHRDVKSATAALALYRQVVDLAALIEAATDGLGEEAEAKPVPVPFAEEVSQ